MKLGKTIYSIPEALIEDVMPLRCTKWHCLRFVMISSRFFGVMLMPEIKVKVERGALYRILIARPTHPFYLS